MITIDLTTEHGDGPCKIARRLLAEGVDPHAILRVMRGETRCFTDHSIQMWAGLTIRENDRTSVKFVKHVPFEGVKHAGA